jgi:lambda family phage portal protein
LPERETEFKTTLQLIETDRLSNPQGASDTEKLRGGLEIDPYGAPTAYWIQKNHPGERLFFSTSAQEWQRIPARTPFGRRQVLHIHEKERTGQSRGKPILTAIMPMFKMLDHYERSELQAAVVNAMIAAFVETPLDAESFGSLFGGSLEDYLAARNEWRIKLEGGSIIPVFPGDKVAPFTPSRPNSGYGAFVENILRHIGTGLNLPFELLMKDFSKTNYSSARAALLEAWRFFMGRRQWLGTYWAKPVYELWLEEAVNAGKIEASDFYQNRMAWTRCKWIGPGRGWVDPVKEAQASQIRMEAGLSTLEDECAQQGLDWEEVLEQRAREKSRMEELGLSDLGTGALKAKSLPNQSTSKQQEEDQ